MERYLNRLISFILAVSVLISIFLCCPISVYATHGGGGSSNHGTLTDEEKNQKLQEFIDNSEAYLIWLLSEIGAITDGDTAQALLNYDSLKAYWNEDHLSFDANDNFVVDQDLVNAVKQTLRQYQLDTDPYYIAFTYPMDRLNYSAFGNRKNVYDTVNNLLEDSKGGFIKINVDQYSSFTQICFSEFDDITDTGFVVTYSHTSEIVSAYRYSTWKNSIETKYRVNLSIDDTAIETIAELKEKSNYTRDYVNYNQSDVYMSKVCDETMAQANGSSPLSGSIDSWTHIVTPTRQSIRVFYSFDDLADYSIGNRKVYFTSGYYDYVPSDITVSIDEMTETVGQLEDVYSQLLEKIDNDTGESEIEELLQQILDEMKNGGGGDNDNKDDGNNGGSSYDDSGLLSLLSGYFEQVLAYLQSISGTVSEGFSSLKGKLDNVSDKLTGRTDDSIDMGTVEDLLQQILDKIDGFTDISTIEDLLQQILDRADDLPDKSMVEDLLQQVLDKIDESTDKSTVEDLLQQILEELKNSNNAPEHWYDDILDYLDKILSQLKSIKRWAVIDTVIDGVDAIADWFDLIHDILSDADNGMESAVSSLSSALDDATGLLKKKFPFSVPWDIFFFVTLLAAEPETPHFEVPIDFDVSSIDMQVHYDFVVDFTDYQYLSDIFRVILSMTYAVGLLKMTAGIVNTRKEE